MGGCDAEIFGRIDRLSSEEVILQLIDSKWACYVLLSTYAVVVQSLLPSLVN